MDTSLDLLQKRAIFYQKVHEIKQAYGFYDPELVCEIIRIFATSFYGSPLWSLNSEEHLKLNRSWNTTVKLVFGLPFQTHKRYVESLTKVPHLQSTLHGRYIGFIDNLKKSKKPEIKFLMDLCQHDQTSNIGQNIRFLMNTYKIDSLEQLLLEKHEIKKNRVHSIEVEEEWKPNVIHELCLAKLGLLEIELEQEVIDEMLENICIE